MSPRRIASLLTALGCAFATAAAEPLQQPPLTPRQANRELNWAQSWMRDVYVRKAEFSLGYPKRACDGADGRDCFQGDHECPRCLWKEDGSELARLGEVYDTVARRIANARPGMSIARLNWLAGQRVGLRVRRGELDAARAAAAECRAEFWWCEALRGLVAQRSGASGEAEARFARVLRTMPQGRACYWKEIALYRDSTALSIGHDAFQRWVREPEPIPRRPCPTDDELRTFWALADPLWSDSGNDRMTEHYARMVDMHIHQQFLETYHAHGAHRHAHHSVVLRHGWPTGFRWEGHRQSVDPLFSDGMHLLYGRGQGFTVALPLEEALRADAESLAPRAPNEGESYLPAYGTIRAVPLQAGFFRRDGRETMVVVATAPSGPGDAAEWHVVSWDGVAYRRTEGRRAANGITAWLETPWRPQIVSVEARAESGTWRGRTGNEPPGAGRVALSSVILLAPTDTLWATLDDAVPHMLATTSFPEGTRTAFYWELYADRAVPAALEVVVRDTRPPGMLSRLFRGSRRPALQVRWEESLEPVNGRFARTFELDVERLEPGSYELELAVNLGSGQVLRSRRVFSVQPRA